jgi:hypothetical protein
MLCGFGAGPSWFIASVIETVWQTRVPAGVIDRPWRALRAALPGGQRLDDQSAFAAVRTRP